MASPRQGSAFRSVVHSCDAQAAASLAAGGSPPRWTFWWATTSFDPTSSAGAARPFASSSSRGACRCTRRSRDPSSGAPPSGLEAARVEVWGDYFAEQLSKRGLSVITPGAIAATLGLAVVRA